MDILQTILLDNSNQVIMLLITGLATWIGTTYKNYINLKQKKDIIEATVKYVEQTSTNLTSREKFSKAKEKVNSWLKEKNIKISDTELEVLIESFVHEFNLKKS